MKNIIQVIFLALIFTKVLGQDSEHKSYIYLSNNNGFVGKIESVPESGKVSFSINGGAIRTYQKDRLLVAFNDYGRYLIVSSLPEAPDQANKLITDFYSSQNNYPTNDIIFKAIPFEIIPCNISYVNEVINFKNLDSTAASINKENVLAIIRKNGTHEIIRDVSEVAPILYFNLDKFSKLFPNSRNETTKVDNPIINKSAVRTDIEVDNQNSLMSNDTPSKPKLTLKEKEQYSKESIDNILIFKDYLNVIGDKRKSVTEKRDAIKAALELFTPGSTIEVTTKNKPGSRKLPIDKYLNNLSNLNYSSIQIDYANLKFISEFSQADDGNYYGLVRGEQTFVGFDENGNPAYSDVVDKNYKVKLESYKKVESGSTATKWKVLLGDVSVSQ